MKLLKNAAVVLVATLATIALIEVALFPYYLRIVPGNAAMSMMQEFGKQLGQSSKADIVPRDYIEITGDSYAEGLGDTLREVGGATRLPYASAHVVAERLGRDVVSVGRGGWGSVNAALEPAMFALQGRQSLLYPVGPPAAIFYYFYEGNDLDDNMRWARLGNGVDLKARPYAPAEIASLVAAQIAANARFGKRLSLFGQANLPALHFMLRTLDLRVIRPTVDRITGAPPRGSGTGPTIAGTTNRALVGGKVVDLPNRLQAPSLGLNEIEWANGVRVAHAALAALKSTNPGIPILVVYVPAPLSSYELASDNVAYQVEGAGQTGVAPATLVAERGQRLRREVCEITRDLETAYVDVTPAIRAASRDRLLHGPLDWTHFNREGYRVLGLTAADFYAANGGKPPQTCG